MQFATGNQRFTSDASVTHKDGLRPKHLQQLNVAYFPEVKWNEDSSPAFPVM